jgi:hypothetical protein
MVIPYLFGMPVAAEPVAKARLALALRIRNSVQKRLGIRRGLWLQ